MIASMTKYSFILLNGKQGDLLETLQQTGLVDITRSAKPMNDKSRDMLAEVELIDGLIKGLGKAEVPEDIQPEVIDGDVQIWVRPLADGSHAIGIFNVGTDNLKVDFRHYFKQLGIGSLKSVRDLWRQQDLSTTETTYFIPSHGVKYIKANY